MNVTEILSGLTEALVNTYQQHAATLAENHAAVVNRLRESALPAFVKMGIPNNKVEDYKYTNLQPLFAGNFEFFPHADTDMHITTEAFRCDVPDLQSHLIFLVNGAFAGVSNKNNLPKGVEISSFKEFATHRAQIVEQYYGQAAPLHHDGIVALNTLLASDGYAIYIPKGVVIEEPLQIVNILTGDTDRLVIQRNLIVVEEDALVRIMVCDHTLSASRFVANTVTEVFVDQRAIFDLYNLQNQHNLTTQIAGTYIRQKANSNVMSNNITLHTGVARNNIHVHMDDEHCESHVYGLYLNDKSQHVDNYVFMDHAKPNCFSSELFKGVIDDYASAAFTGRILVQRDAQKTNAYQSCNNLLLTSDAKVNTKPQLEIYADDVKCSHGATVGQIDENAMFYLRSRGLSPEEARILLMYAFAYEVVEKIRVEPLKEQIRTLVEKRFRGELDKCDACVLCDSKARTAGCM
ncbi:MAG: Fe-S cluster assembly protein SufD [Marinilabiliaceae bacterium]|nr:Fe-S cluster assembly protein SufD [Marinilabiliaceae bacterium]